MYIHIHIHIHVSIEFFLLLNSLSISCGGTDFQLHSKEHLETKPFAHHANQSFPNFTQFGPADGGW